MINFYKFRKILIVYKKYLQLFQLIIFFGAYNIHFSCTNKDIAIIGLQPEKLN